MKRRIYYTKFPRYHRHVLFKEKINGKATARLQRTGVDDHIHSNGSIIIFHGCKHFVLTKRVSLDGRKEISTLIKDNNIPLIEVGSGGKFA